MLRHSLEIKIQAPTGSIAQQKKIYLEQLSTMELGTLKILAEKSKKKGISKKLKQFQHLI